jgi:hypothetical protein
MVHQQQEGAVGLCCDQRSARDRLAFWTAPLLLTTDRSRAANVHIDSEKPYLLWGCHLHEQGAALCSSAAAAAWDPEATAPAAVAVTSCPQAAGILLMQRQLHAVFD